MNPFKNLTQHSTLVARIYARKKSRTWCMQRKLISNQPAVKERITFLNVLPDVVKSVTTHPTVSEIPDLECWLKKLFNHNLTGGKAARGQTVVMAYEMLEKSENITDASMRLAYILGWCVEMFQSYVIIIDDIMDASTRRRGQPCWHLLPGVGNSCAMNDAILVYNGMLYLLKKNFADRKNYADMLDIINETMLYTAFGQFLDVKSSETKKDFSLFTPERQLAITKYKTAYYTYNLPVTLGMLLTGIELDKKTMTQIQDIALDLGTLFQIQDDFIDCYSDETISGKIGTDIQEGKCSWLAVSALQRCSDNQKTVFNCCYGSKEPAHIERIKQLYNQLKLPELYRQVEEKYYDGILEKIKDLPTEEWKRLFHKLLGITYQRKR